MASIKAVQDREYARVKEGRPGAGQFGVQKHARPTPTGTVIPVNADDEVTFDTNGYWTDSDGAWDFHVVRRPYDFSVHSFKARRAPDGSTLVEARLSAYAGMVAFNALGHATLSDTDWENWDARLVWEECLLRNNSEMMSWVNSLEGYLTDRMLERFDAFATDPGLTLYDDNYSYFTMSAELSAGVPLTSRTAEEAISGEQGKNLTLLDPQAEGCPLDKWTAEYINEHPVPDSVKRAIQWSDFE